MNLKLEDNINESIIESASRDLLLENNAMLKTILKNQAIILTYLELIMESDPIETSILHKNDQDNNLALLIKNRLSIFLNESTVIYGSTRIVQIEENSNNDDSQIE